MQSIRWRQTSIKGSIHLMLVMVFISKAQMQGGHSKLQQRKCGPFQIVKMINNNAHVVDLPSWMGI